MLRPSGQPLFPLKTRSVRSRKFLLPSWYTRPPSVQRVSLFEVLNKYSLQVFAFVCAFSILWEKVAEVPQFFREYIRFVEDT